MKLTPTEYSQMVEQASPNHLPPKIFQWRFSLALNLWDWEALRQLYIAAGLGKPEAAACVSVTFIGITAILTGLKVFDNIAKVAGAGTIVPITGFANAIVSPALEFKAEGYVLGLGAKCLSLLGL